MPSLTNRPNGIPVNVYKGTRGRIVIQPDKQLYRVYRDLRADDKVVMDALLELMQSDCNHLIVAGHTAKALEVSTGFTIATIRNSIVRLAATNLVCRTAETNELLISPVFAFKGNETEVWKFMQSIEYKGNIPKEVAIMYTINEWSNM